MSVLESGSFDGRIAVLSPHLDDAILSLGATIAGWRRRGASVVVITVLANDPDLGGGPSPWDEKAGFASSWEAASKRRAEDAEACALVGAACEWLPFGDKEHPRGGTHDEIQAAIQRAVSDADVILVPGYPLTQLGGDHLLVAQVALTIPRGLPHVGLYAEQPYAANRLVKRLLGRAPPLPLPLGGVEWTTSRPSLADWRAKQKAMAAYGSQLPLLGPLIRTRIAIYELLRGGEAIAWVRDGGEISDRLDRCGTQPTTGDAAGVREVPRRGHLDHAAFAELLRGERCRIAARR